MLITREDWLKAPHDARCHAVDGCTGKGYWYSNTPFKEPTGAHYWRWHGHCYMPKFNRVFAEAFADNFDWTLTLEERPSDTCPCPFCHEVEMSILFENNYFYVRCHHCGAAGPVADTEEMAWVLWAKRGEK